MGLLFIFFFNKVSEVTENGPPYDPVYILKTVAYDFYSNASGFLDLYVNYDYPPHVRGVASSAIPETKRKLMALCMTSLVYNHV